MHGHELVPHIINEQADISKSMVFRLPVSSYDSDVLFALCMREV